MKVNFNVKLDAEAELPIRGSRFATGYDVKATAIVKETSDYIMYDTGIALETFTGNVDLQLRARSSIFKTGLMLANGLGTIDIDYNDTIKVIFYKVGNTIKLYEIGERIAQLVVCEFYELEFDVVDSLVDTDRGLGGFGSTGTKEINATLHEKVCNKVCVDMKKDVEIRIIGILIEWLCDRKVASTITLESTFEELNYDSLDMLEIIIAVEEEFHIVIDNSDVAGVKNVQALVDLVNTKTRA